MDYLLQYFSTRDQCQQIDSEAGLLTRIFQRKYLDFLHLQNLNISAEEICYEIMDTYQEGRWQGLKDDQVPAYKEYLTRNTTCQICSYVYIAD